MVQRVGVIGGGQLARMMIAPAVELGVDVRVLAEEPGMSAQLATVAVGDYRDVATVLAFAREVDVVTFDHEHVPIPVLDALLSAGHVVRPGPHALQFAQDKLAMRARIAELGVPQPDWAAVTTVTEVADFLAGHGGRAVLKTPRGGYDGKGVRVITDAGSAEDWFRVLAEDGRGGSLLIEQFVEFRRELAQQVARRPGGQIRLYPVVETIQTNGVCSEVLAPAPGSAQRVAGVAAELAETVAAGIDVTGMLAVELFETEDDRLLVNELAMRPHNSGHWTQDGCTTSQFEQHLRAVLDLPLGDTAPTAEWAVMVNILGGPATELVTDRLGAAMADQPGAKIHTYGKGARPGRKVGHVNVAGNDLDDCVFRARSAAAAFAD